MSEPSPDADGLVRFSCNCAGARASDPHILDGCLAFDIYAAAAPGSEEAAWFSDAEVGHLTRWPGSTGAASGPSKMASKSRTDRRLRSW